MFRLIVFYFAVTSVTFAQGVRQPKIIHGDLVGDVVYEGNTVVSVVNRGEFPYMVAVEYINPNHLCGGVLIAADEVLTAAHCLKGRETVPLQVRAGHLLKTDSKAQVQPVLKFQTHPKFNTTLLGDNNERYLNNDIAYIKLKNPFNLTNLIQPIKLPDIGQDFANLNATALGWGRTQTNHPSPFLKKVELRALSSYDCEKSYIHDGDLSKICLESLTTPKGNTCSGDSGGPVVIHHPERPVDDVLIGIISYGVKPNDYCESQVVANVAYLMPWVNSRT